MRKSKWLHLPQISGGFFKEYLKLTTTETTWFPSYDFEMENHGRKLDSTPIGIPHLDRVIVTLKSSWIARYNFSCLRVDQTVKRQPPPQPFQPGVFFGVTFHGKRHGKLQVNPVFFEVLSFLLLVSVKVIIKMRISQTSHQKPRDSLVRLVVEAKSIFSGKSGKMFWSVFRPSGSGNFTVTSRSPKVMELRMEDDVPIVDLLGTNPQKLTFSPIKPCWCPSSESPNFQGSIFRDVCC